jgi:hypothetical protein
MIKHLWEVKRPSDRPAPPVPVKETRPADAPEAASQTTPATGLSSSEAGAANVPVTPQAEAEKKEQTPVIPGEETQPSAVKEEPK